ncbi:MAG: ACP S-malonyltransferase [Chloroflexota bacterium]|nr:ACP S-malonyltransferase [Chloroflexota bacterium]
MSSATAAFLFPGQGAQRVGMATDLYAASPAARAVFDEADDALGERLSEVVFNGPAEALTLSHNAQPAILTASVACLRAAEERLGAAFPAPAFAAGHSLGEYTALAAAGALALADAVRLVRRRGELMQAASEAAPSGMAAVLGMALTEVEAVCAETGAQVANVNSAEQVVIAARNEALRRASALAEERGARRVVPLDVAGAFHSDVMRPAQQALADELRAVPISAARYPVVANATASPMTQPEEARAELAEQVCAPVLWQASMEFMAAQGAARFVEFGPGKTLTGLARRIVPGAATANVGGLDEARALA